MIMKKQFSKKDNRGIALVSVMIVMTVIMMMATLIVELAYTSLLSRRVNTKSTKNFYAAQGAIDDMSTILQSIAVYSAKQLEGSSSSDFMAVAENTLKEAAGLSDGYLSSTAGVQLGDADQRRLSEFFFNNLSEDQQKILGFKNESTGKYVYKLKDTDTPKFVVTAALKNDSNGTKSRGSITLTIEMNYLDENGYMTNISTDLVLNNVVLRPPASAYELASYSMFTGGGADFTDNNGANYNPQENRTSRAYSTLFQEGNAYIGTQANSKTAINIYSSGVIFDGNRVIINGDVNLFNYGTLIFNGGVSATGEKTKVDIRGTVYIDSSSTLVIGNGIDLLIKDIKISSKKGNSATGDWKDDANTVSIFNGSSTEKANGIAYLNINKSDAVSSNTVWPYQQSSDGAIKSFKNLKESTSRTALMEDSLYYGSWAGSVVYNDGSKSYLVDCQKSNGTYSWHNVSDDKKVSGSVINKDDSLGPIAKATFWDYQGNIHTADSELANFVNLDVLYYQGTRQNTIHMGNIRNLESGTIVRKQTVAVNYNNIQKDYKFNDISIVDGVTTKDAAGKNVLNLTTKIDTSNGKQDVILFPLTKFEFNKKEITGAILKFGISHDNTLHQSENAISWANYWDDFTYHVSKGTVIGTIISANRLSYQNMGGQISVNYALKSIADTDKGQETLENLCNELKYVCAMNWDEFKYNNAGGTPVAEGNGANYKDPTDFNKLYGLGMLDSLYKEGIESFAKKKSGGGTGGPVQFDVSNMYDFITVENWRTN